MHRTAVHAKSIRNDIKAAVKSGTLPAGTKVSVRTRTYAGGSSIDVDIVELPATLPVHNRDRLAYEIEHPRADYWELPGNCRERWSPEAAAVLATVEGIVGAYHVDNSTDDGGDKCWNVNFYKSISFASELTNADRARYVAQVEAARALPVIKPRIVAHLVEWQPKAPAPASAPQLRLVK